MTGYRRPGDTVVDEMKSQLTTQRRLDGDKHNQRRNDSDDCAKLRRNEEHDDTKRVTRRREEQFSMGLRSSDDDGFVPNLTP